MMDKKKLLPTEDFDAVLHQAMMFEAAFNLLPVTLQDERAKVYAAAAIAQAACKELSNRSSRIMPHSDSVEGRDGFHSAFDPVNHLWLCCPECSNPEVSHKTAAGKSYQACFRCRIWLRASGSWEKMNP